MPSASSLLCWSQLPIPGLHPPDTHVDLGPVLRHSQKANETVAGAIQGAFVSGTVQGYSIGQSVGYAAGHSLGFIEGAAGASIAFAALTFIVLLVHRMLKR